MTRNDLLRQTAAYWEGRTACKDGIRRSHNPYWETSNGSHIEPSAWALGWDDEFEKHQQEILEQGGQPV